MAEFETGGRLYRTDKMSARDQLHLLRGLGPLFAPMVQLALMPTGVDQASTNLAFTMAFFEAFAKMEEDEVNVLLNKCLAVVHRQDGTNGSSVWGPPLFSKAAGREQYNDIDLSSMMTICWNVIQENLGGFFAIGSEQPSSVTGLASAPQGLPGLAFPTMKTS